MRLILLNLTPLSCWYPYFVRRGLNGELIVSNSKFFWLMNAAATALYVYCDHVLCPLAETNSLEEWAAKGMSVCLVALYFARLVAAGSIRRALDQATKVQHSPCTCLFMAGYHLLVVVCMTVTGVLGSPPGRRLGAAFYHLYSSNAVSSVASQYFLLLSAVSRLLIAEDLNTKSLQSVRVFRIARTRHSSAVLLSRTVTSAYGSSVFLYVLAVFLFMLQTAGRLSRPASLPKKLTESSFIVLLALQGSKIARALLSKHGADVPSICEEGLRYGC
ncbi:hypothetical protein AAG570_003416 [Ranatra chinensis]|uniref:Vomeronasal type-1 receptor n=1 Tax=Ranatra chinensis TaxID=642074 RepID=A0ABD0YS61_9HEMI